MFTRISRENHYSESLTVLSVLDFGQLPFQPKRIYWIDKLSSSQSRGFHAHKKLTQVLIVVRGRLRLRLKRGLTAFDVVIDEADSHILIPAGTWRELYAESEETVVLVIADSAYDEDDYIRNFTEYIEWWNGEFLEN